MMDRRVIGLAGVGVVLMMAGCVDRRISITSEPQGARVWLNDTEVGVTPVEVNFTYFGVYDVRLRKDGYEPLVTSAEAKAPFHEWPVVDMVFLPMPFTKETRIAWHFDLQPSEVDPAATVQRAAELRAQLGSQLGDAEGEPGQAGPDPATP